LGLVARFLLAIVVVFVTSDVSLLCRLFLREGRVSCRRLVGPIASGVRRRLDLVHTRRYGIWFLIFGAADFWLGCRWLGFGRGRAFSLRRGFAKKLFANLWQSRHL